MILSHHSRLTSECHEEEINDDDDDDCVVQVRLAEQTSRLGPGLSMSGRARHRERRSVSRYDGSVVPKERERALKTAGFVSHKVLLKLFCRSQLLQESVNLFLTITIIKN